MGKSGFRNGNKQQNGAKQQRKEFRQQHRNLRKKSKYLARQFGQQHRQSKLNIVVNGNGPQHAQNNNKKKKSQQNNQATHPNPPRCSHGRRVQFAVNPIWDSDDEQPAGQFVGASPKSILTTSDSFTHQQQQQQKEQQQQQQPQQKKQQQQQWPDDTWVDERDERWIKTLELKLGFKQSAKQYWKRTEFTQDGLDCFFDLENFSGESDVDDDEKERYNEYFEFRNFVQNKNENANGHGTSTTSTSLKSAEFDAFKAHKQKKQTQQQQQQSTDADTEQTARKETSDSATEKARKRKQKMEIYGQSVYDSDEDADAEDGEDPDGDTAIRDFLEDRDWNHVQLDDNVNGSTSTSNGKHNSSSSSTSHAAKLDTCVLGKYVPPQLRKLQLLGSSGDNTEAQLKRQLGAHLNRLLSNNLPSIVNLVNAYYRDEHERYSSKQVTVALCDCVRSMLDKEEETPALSSIILCVAALLTSVHCSNGVFVGSNIIELVTAYFNDDFDRMHESKLVHNLLRLLSYLYLFGMIGAKYLIEILQQCVRRCDAGTFSVLRVPMLICGVELRNTDPIKFKELIVAICDTSKLLLAEAADTSSATKHCLDIERTMQTVFAIKDNKACNALSQKSNISQYTAHCGVFKRLKLSLNAMKLKYSSSSTAVSGDERLAMSYTDIMNIAQHGRWWLPGAPVKGGLIRTKLSNSNGQAQTQPQTIWKSRDAAYSFPDQLLLMSKKFHMNTPIRRAIFCMVMDSDDYVEAFQKLQQLNMGDGQHTEIIRIVLLLCVRQTQFNPYYALLLGKLVQSRKGWKFSLHCACWDKFAELDEMSTSDIVNLAKLLAHMLHLRSLNLVVLKRLDIMRTSPQNVLFVHTLFTTLLNKNLSSTTNNAMNDVFGSLQGNKQLAELKQDIEMFFHTVLIPRTKTQIATLKQEHQNAQQMVHQNTMQRQELVNIGLKLRQQENFLIIAKNALSATQDYQLKTSMYNHLIS